MSTTLMLKRRMDGTYAGRLNDGKLVQVFRDPRGYLALHEDGRRLFASNLQAMMELAGANWNQ